MTKVKENKFAVVRTGGKQYRVSEGDVLEVEKIEGEDGAPLAIDEVLLIADGDLVEIGHPLLEKAKVSAKILSQEKADKIVVFKYKAKKNYRKKTGHRQKLTKIQIEKISVK